MSEHYLRRPSSVWRQADALAAWLLLGWLGQRLGWSLASGVLPVVLWWALRGAAHGPLPALRRPSSTVFPALTLLATLGGLLGAATTMASLPLLLAAAAAWGLWSAALLPARTLNAPQPLRHMAMGLMMGTLWLSGQWCLGPGWTQGQTVAVHLGLMAGVSLLRAGPALWRITLRHWQAQALVAVGALLLAIWTSTGAHLGGMALVVLAWGLPAPAGPTAHRVWPVAPGFWLGPALLLAVGMAAPTQGPAALRWAWSVLALLAGLALAGAWRPLARDPRSSPSSSHRWSDAA